MGWSIRLFVYYVSTCFILYHMYLLCANHHSVDALIVAIYRYLPPLSAVRYLGREREVVRKRMRMWRKWPLVLHQQHHPIDSLCVSSSSMPTHCNIFYKCTQVRVAQWWHPEEEQARKCILGPLKLDRRNGRPLSMMRTASILRWPALATPNSNVSPCLLPYRVDIAMTGSGQFAPVQPTPASLYSRRWYWRKWFLLEFLISNSSSSRNGEFQ